MTSGLILPNIPFTYWGIEFKIDESRITGIKLPNIFKILGISGDYNTHLDANQQKASLFAWVFAGFGHGSQIIGDVVRKSRDSLCRKGHIF